MKLFPRFTATVQQYKSICRLVFIRSVEFPPIINDVFNLQRTYIFAQNTLNLFYSEDSESIFITMKFI